MALKGKQMEDFMNWLEYEAPELVRMVAVFVMLCGIFLFFGIIVWAVINKYWVVPAMFPLIGVWVILHTYQKSKKGGE
jgi:membrane protein insertase Oxa1/YidC/SpoIIIJ